mgnify:CR=1 FL=1
MKRALSRLRQCVDTQNVSFDLYPATALPPEFLRMYSSNKQNLHKSSSSLVILILILFVGEDTNTDVFGSIPSVDTDSYCTLPSVEQIKSKELGFVMISFY